MSCVAIRQVLDMKKIWALLPAAVLALALAGCGTEYVDTNGDDDFTLQTITDENIVKLDLGASGLTYSEQEFGFGITSTEYSSKNFNGVEEIYLTNYIFPSSFYIYVGYLNVSSGNFKLAVVNNDEVIREIPIGTFSEQIYFEDIQGSFAIRLAGESAAFQLNIDTEM